MASEERRWCFGQRRGENDLAIPVISLMGDTYGIDIGDSDYIGIR